MQFVQHPQTPLSTPGGRPLERWPVTIYDVTNVVLVYHLE